MNLTTIRTGLTNRLANITGLGTYDTVPAAPQPPCAYVFPDTPAVTVHSSMGHGFCEAMFVVVVLVQLGDWPSAQNALDAYVSTGSAETSSVVEALEATTTTVAGGAQQVVVTEIGNYGTMEFGSDTYASVEFKVTVPASRA